MPVLVVVVGRGRGGPRDTRDTTCPVEADNVAILPEVYRYD